MKDWNESKIEAVLDYINRRKASLLDHYVKALDEGDEKNADLFQELLLEMQSMLEVTIRIMEM